MAPIRKKLVIVGDPASGRRTLLWVFAEDNFSESIPEIFENKLVDIEVDGIKV